MNEREAGTTGGFRSLYLRQHARDGDPDLSSIEVNLVPDLDLLNPTSPLMRVILPGTTVAALLDYGGLLSSEVI